MRTHPGFIEVTLASLLLWHFAIPCSAIFDFPSPSLIDVQKESVVEFGATWLEDSTKKDHAKEESSKLACDSVSETSKTLAEKLENLGLLFKNDNHPVSKNGDSSAATTGNTTMLTEALPSKTVGKIVAFESAHKPDSLKG